MKFPAFASSITHLSEPEYRYSICTLVSQPSEYAEMADSFVKAGFEPEFCEFLYCDNSQINQMDAFAGYNAFLSAAKGKYIILCHQDILLTDHRIEKLEECIRELDAIDPKWALLGNAGGIEFGRNAIRITHPNGQQNTGHFPARVQSLDENFILAKRSANLCLSHDLAGFHFYGTDICQVAIYLGLTAWVVDFHLFHKSTGNWNRNLVDDLLAISRKYRSNHGNGYIQTTCALIPTGKSHWREKRALFLLLRRLKKQRESHQQSADLQNHIMKSLGRWHYAVHWILYKLVVPFYNLRRSVRKRL